jgi:putative ABC transport system permease protein
MIALLIQEVTAMKIIKYLQVAVESILAHKLRAILTMLGIIIGVAAVLSTSGIGRGASASITDRIKSQGTNLLSVSSGAARSGGVSQGGGSIATLTLGDVTALQEPSLGLPKSTIVPEYSSRTVLVYGNNNSSTQVVGTTPDYMTIHNMTVSNGKFITKELADAGKQVVVLGDTLATDLFATAEPVGQSIRINNVPFEVIGVLKATGGSGFNSTDNQAFVPIGVAQGRLFSASRYRGSYVVTGITISVDKEEDMTEVQRLAEMVFRMRHNLQAKTDNDFRIFNQASLLETMSSVTETLTIFLGAIGAISLIVGGIGIMNIMLVSVTERTREIGLRKALGAHDSDILLQFLVEALVICTIGGVIGVGLSYLVAYIVSLLPAVSFKVLIEADSIILAIGVSLLSGLVFGLYPAMRATRLDPSEALRYE